MTVALDLRPLDKQLTCLKTDWEHSQKNKKLQSDTGYEGKITTFVSELFKEFTKFEKAEQEAEKEVEEAAKRGANEAAEECVKKVQHAKEQIQAIKGFVLKVGSFHLPIGEQSQKDLNSIIKHGNPLFDKAEREMARTKRKRPEASFKELQNVYCRRDGDPGNWDLLNISDDHVLLLLSNQPEGTFIVCATYCTCPDDCRCSEGYDECSKGCTCFGSEVEIAFLKKGESTQSVRPIRRQDGQYYDIPRRKMFNTFQDVLTDAVRRKHIDLSKGITQKEAEDFLYLPPIPAVGPVPPLRKPKSLESHLKTNPVPTPRINDKYVPTPQSGSFAQSNAAKFKELEDAYGRKVGNSGTWELIPVHPNYDEVTFRKKTQKLFNDLPPKSFLVFYQYPTRVCEVIILLLEENNTLLEKNNIFKIYSVYRNDGKYVTDPGKTVYNTFQDFLEALVQQGRIDLSMGINQQQAAALFYLPPAPAKAKANLPPIPEEAGMEPPEKRRRLNNQEDEKSKVDLAAPLNHSASSSKSSANHSTGSVK